MNLRPLMAYLPWHARDVAVRVFAPFLVFLMLAGIPLGVFTGTTGLPLLGGEPRVQALAESLWGSTASLCILIGSVLLMNGSFALDREKQHVRVLFAHQVPPELFYLQRFAVGLALFAATFIFIPVLFSQIVEVPILGTLLALLLTGFFIGSLLLLIGAVTQRDGLAFIGVFLVANVLQSATQSGNGPAWLRGLAWFLPPVKQVSDFSTAWLGGRTVEPQDLVLVLGYGIGMLVSALVLIKRAPLVR
jgi:uncharacterized membrane protein